MADIQLNVDGLGGIECLNDGGCADYRRWITAVSTVCERQTSVVIRLLRTGSKKRLTSLCEAAMLRIIE